MAKKEDSLPSLAAVVRTGNSTLAVYNVVPLAGTALTKQELQIATETQRQMQVMRNQRLKTGAAMEEMERIHKHAADEFHSVASHVAELNEESRGKSYQAIVEEFNKYNTELAATHLLGAIKVGAHTIAEQISRPIDVPLIEEKPATKHGLLARVIGGNP